MLCQKHHQEQNRYQGLHSLMLKQQKETKQWFTVQHLSLQLDSSGLICGAAFWTSRSGQSWVYAGNQPLSTGTAMFCLVLDIQHTPFLPSIIFSILTALGEVLTNYSPYVLALKTFLERQLDCLDAQQSPLLCKSLVIQGSLLSIIFSIFPLIYLKCNHHFCSASLQ